MESTNFVIETRAITKSFGGLTALRGVDLSVRQGSIHALLGQNGAGKSTLVKILNGVHVEGSYGGTIVVEGRPVAFRSPEEASAAGVGYVPQEIEVLEQLTVAENVFVGRMALGRGTLVRRAEVESATRRIFADIGITLDPREIAASLTSAQRHLIMIARALVAKPRVLMLDEPTASLSGLEVVALFSALRRLRDQGVTMIYITHRLPEVIELCDSASVLRDGKVAAHFERAEFDADRFILAMSGQRLERLFPERRETPGTKPVLKVEALTVPGHSGAVFGAQDVSFTVAEGEILGLAGLLGSGRSEILHGIFGRVPAIGRVEVDGKQVVLRQPADARAAGIALLTEDRKRDGLLFNLNVGSNITIGNLGSLAKRGIVSFKAERNAVADSMRALRVKAPSAQASVAHLSGGNQQKLLFARVLMSTPRVLMLDEPTKGVDAATRAEIYRLVADLADQGVALVIVSSELEEIIGLADRILTVADGRVVDEFRRGEGGEDRVLRAVAAAQTTRLAQTMVEETAQ